MRVKKKGAPPAADQRLCISVPEAGRQLGISRAHAFTMAASGVLPTLRLGKRVVVPIAALQRVLDAAGAGAAHTGQRCRSAHR